MSKYTKKNQQTGHPAKKDPVIARLSKLQVEIVMLTQALEGRLPEETYWNFKGAAFGIMDAYAILTGMPRPGTQVDIDFDEFMKYKEAEREAEELKRQKIEEAKKRHPAGKRLGMTPTLAVIDEIKSVTLNDQTIRACRRCQHMTFNHALSSSGVYYDCSFTNCACDKFV